MVICQFENYPPLVAICPNPILDKDKFEFTVSKVFPMVICDTVGHEMTILTTKSGAEVPVSCRLVDNVGNVVAQQVRGVKKTGSYFQVLSDSWQLAAVGSRLLQ